MCDKQSIYENIFYLGMQIYFLSESRISRILRGFCSDSLHLEM